MYIEAIKLISLFFSIWFVSVNAVMFQRGLTISSKNFMVMSGALTAFIYCTFMV